MITLGSVMRDAETSILRRALHLTATLRYALVRSVPLVRPVGANIDCHSIVRIGQTAEIKERAITMHRRLSYKLDREILLKLLTLPQNRGSFLRHP